MLRDFDQLRGNLLMAPYWMIEGKLEKLLCVVCKISNSFCAKIIGIMIMIMILSTGRTNA